TTLTSTALSVSLFPIVPDTVIGAGKRKPKFVPSLEPLPLFSRLLVAHKQHLVAFLQGEGSKMTGGQLHELWTAPNAGLSFATVLIQVKPRGFSLVLEGEGEERKLTVNVDVDPGKTGLLLKGWFPQTDSKDPLLKTTLTQLIEYGEVELVPTLNLYPCVLVSLA
ncbi:hypothetical protein STEG23_026930, partial [Scotinomys teguina]